MVVGDPRIGNARNRARGHQKDDRFHNRSGFVEPCAHVIVIGKLRRRHIDRCRNAGKSRSRNHYRSEHGAIEALAPAMVIVNV